MVSHNLGDLIVELIVRRLSCNLIAVQQRGNIFMSGCFLRNLDVWGCRYNDDYYHMTRLFGLPFSFYNQYYF